MKRVSLLLFRLATLALAATAASSFAQETAAPPPAETSSADKFGHDTQADAARNTTAAAAVTAMPGISPAGRTPDFLEHVADVVLEIFDVQGSGNTAARYAISAFLLVGAFLLRHVVTGLIFNPLKKLAGKTTTTLDDKMFPALEAPVATLVMVAGIFAALKVLKLSESTDVAVGYGSTVAFSLVLFWGLLQAFNALLDHMHGMAKERGLGIAAFMPWIKKALVTVFVVFGVLLVAQSLGADVKAFLAGLGIGGLAFALAAQDTLANLFGSIVVAVDQPFKVGEFVQIGSHSGTVEEIGLRSTKLRTPARTLIAIPNKSVASDVINNFTRMPQRRVEQTIGLTYATTPEQMEQILGDIRALLTGDPEVHQDFIAVNFTNYGASSVDILIIYFANDPDFRKHLVLRERMNLAIMRAVAARGLSFAFPTQTVHLEGDLARRFAGRKD